MDGSSPRTGHETMTRMVAIAPSTCPWPVYMTVRQVRAVGKTYANWRRSVASVETVACLGRRRRHPFARLPLGGVVPPNVFAAKRADRPPPTAAYNNNHPRSRRSHPRRFWPSLSRRNFVQQPVSNFQTQTVINNIILIMLYVGESAWQLLLYGVLEKTRIRTFRFSSRFADWYLTTTIIMHRES